MSDYTARLYSFGYNDSAHTCEASILLNNQLLRMTHEAKTHTTTVFSDYLYQSLIKSGTGADAATKQLNTDEVESSLPGVLGVLTPLFEGLKGDHAAAKHEKWVFRPTGDGRTSQ